MNVRPFDWRDLPALHRYRSQCLFLDSALVLTSGPFFAPAGALLSTLSPATGILTFIAHDEAERNTSLIGQVTHTAGQGSARISFFAPQSAANQADLAALIEAMSVQVGERGGMFILAEVDSAEPVFEQLRQAGFGVFARQRVWRLGNSPAGKPLPGLRRAVAGPDTAAIRFLYANLVPGLVQQVEPPPSNRLQGLVYYQGNELLVYMEVRYGPRGIWVQPFIHPNAESVAAPLIRLLQELPYRNGRPVYVCVRSYQSWLESIIEGVGAEPSPSQAVLVRHLALARRQPVANSVVVLNGKTAEPTVPVARLRR